MAYLIDTDIFIAAKNLHYGMDFCPAFWEWLVESNYAGKLLSIEAVHDRFHDPLDGSRLGSLVIMVNGRNQFFGLVGHSGP